MNSLNGSEKDEWWGSVEAKGILHSHFRRRAHRYIRYRYITHNSKKKSWKTRKETSLILYFFLFHFLLQQLSEDIGYVLYSALGSFYIPSCIMVFVYIRIYYAAKARARRGIRKQPRKPPNEQVSENSSPSHSPHRHHSSQQHWGMMKDAGIAKAERERAREGLKSVLNFWCSVPHWEWLLGLLPLPFSSSQSIYSRCL